MFINTACQALRERKCLELRYDGYSRVVEVHAAGYSKDGNALMRVWQIRGGSVSGERVGWKLMRLDEALSAHLVEEPSGAPRKGYNRGDPAIANIICQL
jgi:hypothetical protein